MCVSIFNTNCTLNDIIQLHWNFAPNLLNHKKKCFYVCFNAPSLRMRSKPMWWNTLEKPALSIPPPRLQKQRPIVSARFNRTCAFIGARPISSPNQLAQSHIYL